MKFPWFRDKRAYLTPFSTEESKLLYWNKINAGSRPVGLLTTNKQGAASTIPPRRFRFNTQASGGLKLIKHALLRRLTSVTVPENHFSLFKNQMGPVWMM